MEGLFLNVVKISLLCSVIILFVFVISPFLKQKHTVFWRHFLWIVLGVRLILPFDFSVSEPLVTIPLFPMKQAEQITVINNRKSLISQNQESLSSENIQKNNSVIISERNHPESNRKGEMLSNTQNQMADFKDAKRQNIENTKTKAEQLEAKEQLSIGMRTLSLIGKLDFYMFLSLIWIIGCIVLTIFQLSAYWHFRKNLECTKTYLFEKEGVSVFSSLLVSSPMLIGILKPQIFLPEKKYDEEALSFILNHELIHYKRKDLWIKLLLAAARTIHWFNPLIYQMEKQAGKDMELLCDSQAVQAFSKEEKKKYSQILLSCAAERKNPFHVICSSEFSENAKTLKERFDNIFSDKKRKKGIIITTLGVCVIVAISLFVAFGNSKTEPPVKNQPENTNGTNEIEITDNPTKEDSVINLLLIGEDTIETEITETTENIDSTDNTEDVHWEEKDTEDGRGDAIMVLTFNQKQERIILTSFLRDIHVTISEYSDSKLSDAYRLGGGSLLAETIEQNFNIPIHGYISCDYEGIEKAIDIIGGIGMALTASEAEYLNNTNYITKTENRNVTEGFQILNGSQALGYARIRQVSDRNGQRNDFGRTYRQREVLYSIFETCKEKDLEELRKIAGQMIPYINGDIIETDSFQKYLDIGKDLVKKTKPETFCVPIEGTYSIQVINGRSVLSVDFEKINEALQEELYGVGWKEREYLFQDKVGWEYYIEADLKKESRVFEFADVLEPMLLVRYKDDKRQILEDLIIKDFAQECPVLYVTDRIIYKAAPTADIIGIKEPVLVSIATDGSDRKTADTMLHHHFENICEDDGWIYYSGWTNAGEYPRPLCRIAPDFEGEPQYIDDIPGILCGVYNNNAFYLANEEVGKAGIYRRNLKTGEDTVHDKWGIYADEIAYFHAREKIYPTGELYEWEAPGVNIQWAYEYGDEIHEYDVPLYTEH